MRAGELRHRVTLEAPGTTPDAHGELIAGWTPLLTAFAAVAPLTGRELQNAAALFAEVTATITIRYRTGINAKQRVLVDGAVFEVLGVVDPELRHRELVLYCRVLG